MDPEECQARQEEPREQESEQWYWCHVCNKRVQLQGDHFACPDCNDSFLEEVEGVGSNEQAENDEDDSDSEADGPVGAFARGLGALLGNTEGIDVQPVDTGDGHQGAQVQVTIEALGRLLGVLSDRSSDSTNRPNTRSSTRSTRSSTRHARQSVPESHEGRVSEDRRPHSAGSGDDLVAEVVDHVDNEDELGLGHDEENDGDNEVADGSETGPLPGNPGDTFSDILMRFLQAALAQNSSGRGNSGRLPPGLELFSMYGSPEDYAWGPNGMDEIISRLMEQAPNQGPPPASEDAINALPEMLYTEKHREQGWDECPVCRDTFELQARLRHLPCQHFFHFECIKSWLIVHGTCPVCRVSLEDQGSTTQSSQ
eukprot:Clim_evm14s148 gene=Clim_evmTU14s148